MIDKNIIVNECPRGKRTLSRSMMERLPVMIMMIIIIIMIILMIMIMIKKK